MSAVKTIAFAAALAGAVPTAATTITFDTLPGGGVVPIMTSINTQYASLGVTFAGAAGATMGSPTASDYSGGPSNDYYARNYLGNYALPTAYGNTLLAQRFETLSILFSSPVSGVSFGLNTFFTQGFATFKAYGATGTLLQNVVLSANGGWDLRSLNARGISRIDVSGTTFDNGALTIFGIDQLSFTQDASAVPEPATWAMLIGGFALAGGALRRRARVTVRFA